MKHEEAISQLTAIVSFDDIFSITATYATGPDRTLCGTMKQLTRGVSDDTAIKSIEFWAINELNEPEIVKVSRRQWLEHQDSYSLLKSAF